MHNIFKQNFRKNFFLAFIAFSLFSSNASFAQEAPQTYVEPSEYNKFEPAKVSENGQAVIEVWNSVEGIKRLNNSQFKNDFYELVGFFQPQINPLYCGIASSVIVLNAFGMRNNDIESQKNLEVLTPSSMGGATLPFRSYSQLTFLNNKTDKIKDRRVIELNNIEEDEDKIDPGLTLDQLSEMLSKAYNLKIETTHIKKINERTLNDFRETLKKILNDQDHYLIVNFNSKILGLRGAGHISPIVAYDTDSDSVLVLDVAGHKRPWYWVKTEYLVKAMNTLDGKKYRGYVIVSQRGK